MRYPCIILGFLTGKTNVKCDECANLIPVEAAARLACVAITIDAMTGRKKVEKK